MTTVKLLVQIAVMMIVPAAFRRHRERGGERPLLLLLLLPWLPPRWEENFSSGPWPQWLPEGRIPSEIGSLSLSVSLLFHVCFLTPSPFSIFAEIHNSDWAEILRDFLWKLSFLRRKKGPNRRSRESQGNTARPRPLGRTLFPCGHLGHRLALILLPKNHIYSKIILRKILSCLDFI